MTFTSVSRRHLLQGGVAAIAASKAGIASARQARAEERVPLWPGRPPGYRGSRILRRVDEQSRDPTKTDRWITGIAEPELVVRRPARPNGSAVLLVPGGGYGFLAYDNEGTSQAAWLNVRGITAFILSYRLPGEGWNARELVPLQDAQRAMRLIRAGAASYGIDAGRVTVLGFSAGGHLAGSLATRHAERVYAPGDRVDALSARPDLAGLVYPVISLEADFTHAGSRDNLLGPGASAASLRAASVDRRVGPDTPPVFLLHASDDGLVPAANSLALYSAMTATNRPAELHLFDEGGHGFGVRLPRTMPAAAWPELFHAFGRRKGVFSG